MFEKYTQKAIDIVQSALNYATLFHHRKVLSQHIFIGLVSQSKGVQAKILNFDKIDFAQLTSEVRTCLPNTFDGDINDVYFSSEARSILKKSVELCEKLNSKFVMPQHIALALLLSKECGAYSIIQKFDINQEKIISNLLRILDKSSDIISPHPEEKSNSGSQLSNINDFFKEKIMTEILSNAETKLSAKGYEIVGTEQLLQSILDNKDYKIVEILNKYSVDSEVFAQKLSKITSRSAEFENSEKQIIFTPNAFATLLLAVDYAKESGSVEILPEHIVLGILKSKRGIAYQILSSILPNSIDFEDIVMKKLNDKVPETLAILRLAKTEALALNYSTIGSEMILLGILSYSSGIAANTLRRLGITLKDVRCEIEKLVKPQKITSDVTYSQNAKKILEIAYKTASEHKKTKIKSENILYAITKLSDCLAMQILSNLGTDILEIQQGIKQELLGGMDL